MLKMASRHAQCVSPKAENINGGKDSLFYAACGSLKQNIIAKKFFTFAP